MKERMATIYAIRNLTNNKVYVGSTINEVIIRWRQHINTVNSGKAWNPVFAADWKSTTPDQWQFILLEENVPRRMRFALEFHWVRQMKSCNPVYGYNLAKSYVTLLPAKDFITSEKLIKGIIESLKEGLVYRDIKKQFGVSLGSITRVKRLFFPDNWKSEKRKFPKIGMEKTDLIIEAIKEGKLKLVEIASKFNVSQNIVAGIKYRFLPDKIRKGITLDQRTLIKKLAGSMTYRDISQKVGVSLASVSNIIHSDVQ